MAMVVGIIVVLVLMVLEELIATKIVSAMHVMTIIMKMLILMVWCRCFAIWLSGGW